MRWFVIVMVVLLLARFIGRLFWLKWNVWPKKVYWSQRDVHTTQITSLILMSWGLYLLWTT